MENEEISLGDGFKLSRSLNRMIFEEFDEQGTINSIVLEWAETSKLRSLIIQDTRKAIFKFVGERKTVNVESLLKFINTIA